MKTIDRSINIGKGSNIKNLNTSGHTLISPEGNLVHIVNISRFARDNNLHQGAISNVVNGKANHHKGWKLA